MIKSNNKCFKFFLSIIVCICFISVFSQQSEIPLKIAATAYNQFDLKKSRNIYEKIVASPLSTGTERVESLQNLAQQDWKIFRNYKSAMQRLHFALLINDNKNKTFVLSGQINLEAGKNIIANDFANDAMKDAKNETEKISASLLKAQIIHDENIDLVKDGKAPDNVELLEAQAYLNLFYQNNREIRLRLNYY